ncbi:MAG: hypothetical protein GC154_19770 [bacterium]|nr:hypothetical protein [bacterium]
MNKDRLLRELTEWKLDHPGADPPPHLREAMKGDSSMEADWKSTQAWIAKLHQPDEWKPDDAFFERLTQNAVREKRRAALSDSTRRELSLERTVWGIPVWLLGWKPVLTAAVFLFVIAPASAWFYNAYETIGSVQFANGYVMTESASSPAVNRDAPIRRGQTIQTASAAQSVISLESGVHISLDSRSRITFNNAGEIALHMGRVYFDVPAGASGFKVNLPQGDVRVIGTSFSIEVTRDGDSILVTRGVVQVANSIDSKLVRQGNLSTLQKNAAPSVTPAPDVAAKVAWVRKLNDEWDKEDMKRYFPSLAAPEKSE